MCFVFNIAKFLRATFLKNTSGGHLWIHVSLQEACKNNVATTHILNQEVKLTTFFQLSNFLGIYPLWRVYVIHNQGFP